MKRRTFILTSAIAGMAIAAPFLYKRYRLSKWDEPLIHPATLSIFCGEEEIRRIGMSYRSEFPAETSEKQLIELLLPGNAGKIVSPTDDSVDGLKLIKKIQQEFKSGEIITINGWILSLTEARQCALLSFT